MELDSDAYFNEKLLDHRLQMRRSTEVMNKEVLYIDFHDKLNK